MFGYRRSNTRNGINEIRQEIALHYLSRTLVGAELKYSPIEKNLLVTLLFHSKVKELHASLFGTGDL